MTENHQDPLTLVEIEAQSAHNTNDETNCNNNQSIEQPAEIASAVKINGHRFHMLCDTVQSCFSQIDNSMFELVELKDILLLQYLPRNVSLRITLVLSRFYRAYSQTQIPVYELIRLVKLYSQSFDRKCTVLKKLHDSNETKKRMLNIALQRLTSMEHNTEQYREQKCINNWEKMYICLALPRSNVRKWKFRIQTFREKAILGYEHVIEWLHMTIPRSEISSAEESIDNDQLETSDEIITEPEIDEQKPQTNHGSDYVEEIGSDKEGSFLSSAGTQKSRQGQQQPIMTKIDIEVQVQPDSDDQQTSTEEILSNKSLIIRIYRPIGIYKTQFQCIVHAQGQKYTTNKFNVSIDEDPKNKGRITDSRKIKPIDSKTKKRSEVSTVPDDIIINTIDEKQNDVLLIPMSSVFKRGSLFQNETDPDAIKIDVLGDNKLCGSLIFSSEDLQMLDLPTLHSPTLSPLTAIDDSISPISTKTNQLDFDQPSNELYQSWISRTPHTFAICNDEYEPIGKLPLLMFWYNQIENTHATKCTMTIPIGESEINEEVISSPVATMTEPICADDHIEIIKATYENQIAEIHENYQAEIHRLTKLLTELPNQMIDISELDENASEMVQEGLSNTNIRRQMRQRSKRESSMEYRQTHVYEKGSPKNFLDRTEMYAQRSIIHRHELIAKVEQETALAYERQMEIHRRLHRSQENNAYDGLCLPAVFMPFRSGNVFNPRAYQFFHSLGSTGSRLTQSPSIVKLPSLPSGTVSVLNLFELNQRYDTDHEKDRAINNTTSQSFNPTTQESD